MGQYIVFKRELWVKTVRIPIEAESPKQAIDFVKAEDTTGKTTIPSISRTAMTKHGESKNLPRRYKS